jgi:hypothetical protein
MSEQASQIDYGIRARLVSIKFGVRWSERSGDTALDVPLSAEIAK